MGKKKKMNEEKQNSFIRFGVTEDQKKTLKTFSNQLNMSSSEFIRQAIFEKIRRIEHPEQFSQSNISQMIPAIFEQLTQDTKKVIELQKLTNERLNIAENIEKTTQAMKEQYKKLEKANLISNFSEESEEIGYLLKAHKSLSPDQINKMSQINLDNIILILTTFDKFKLNITTGRYELR